MAKPSMIDEYILGPNQEKHDHKVWKDKGISLALAYQYDKEQAKKEFDERFLQAQRLPRSRFNQWLRCKTWTDAAPGSL